MAQLRVPVPPDTAAPITLPEGIGIPSCPKVLLALRDELAREDTPLVYLALGSSADRRLALTLTVLDYGAVARLLMNLPEDTA